MATISKLDYVPIWRLVKAFDLPFTRVSDLLRDAGIPTYRDDFGQIYVFKPALQDLLIDAAVRAGKK